MGEFVGGGLGLELASETKMKAMAMDDEDNGPELQKMDGGVAFGRIGGP